MFDWLVPTLLVGNGLAKAGLKCGYVFMRLENDGGREIGNLGCFTWAAAATEIDAEGDP